MNDLFNFIAPKGKYTMTATYYARRPLTTADYGQKFRYKKIDPRRMSYGSVIQNVIEDNEVSAIETISPIDFKIKGYIQAQDGLMYQITEIERHEDNGNEHLMFKHSIDERKLMRLIRVDNLEELDNSGL